MAGKRDSRRSTISFSIDYGFNENVVMVVVVTKKSRHESRIDTGQFPKQARACREVGRRASPPGNFCGFSLLEFPFPGFLSHSDRILVRFQL